MSLEVTPQITPDDKIIMDLEVKKDRVGQYVRTGVGLTEAPAIETQSVTTQVLVGNGETAVLGGLPRRPAGQFPDRRAGSAELGDVDGHHAVATTTR